MVDSINYEVGTHPDVNQDWATIGCGAFDSPPYLLADMQTTNVWDNCSLRYRDKTSSSVQIKVDEEQSSDTEKGHCGETVGYMCFQQTLL